MEMIKRVVAVFLVLVAIAVVAQAVIPGDRHELYDYLNPLMAVSVVLLVAFCVWSGGWRPGGADGESTAGGLSETRLVFFAALFVAYLFFLNWFKELDEGEGYGWVWIVLNGVVPVLNVWAGIRLWTRESE